MSIRFLRRHPHLYEINTWPWLEGLSRRHGRALTLGAVPDEHWDALRALGIDLVYLMGVWRRSAIGREIAQRELSLFDAYERALPGWRPQDVVGSAYSISGYEPDPRVGTWQELDSVRAKLHARGMQLVVDFIPNHMGFDHRWMRDHPDRFVNASEDEYKRDPSRFRAVATASGDTRFVACGRDPFFPPWTDVAQVNYFSDDARRAMLAELEAIARHADGVRCDMAMLVLSSVFGRTWGDLVKGPPPPTEFWAQARAAVPDLLMIAEVYWDLEWPLQQLGFDFTYDKRLYDRLRGGAPQEVRGHLRAEPEYQRRSARFIENHDEARSVVAFGDRVAPAAVVVSTLPGMRFYHDGQFEGRRARLPVQLGVAADEPVDNGLLTFYRRLLEIVGAPVFHSGEWRLVDVSPSGDDTDGRLVAWRWRDGPELRVVAVNLGDGHAQGDLRLNGDLPGAAASLAFDDLLSGHRYLQQRSALEASGLHVRLERGQSHIFSVRQAS